LLANDYRDSLVSRLVSPTRTILQALETRVENERAFAIQNHDGVLEGFIDRMVWLYEGYELLGAEIIDFKTDTVTSETIEERVNHYQPQLNAYVDAITTISGLPSDKIKAYLLFVETGQLIEIEKKARAESVIGDKPPKPRSSGNSAAIPEPKAKSSKQTKQLKFWE